MATTTQIQSISTWPSNKTYPYPETNPQTRIHILGIGNIGKIVAHSLRTLPSPPPISLLFQDKTRQLKFEAAGSVISLLRPHRDESFVTGFDSEISNVYAADGTPIISPWPIWNLIVTTKAHHTVAALRPIASRLTKDSTVVILQNGMGVIDEIKAEIFPDPASRPHFVTGITTHGVYSKSQFSVVQKGFGNIRLGYIPDRPTIEAPPQNSSWFSQVEPLVTDKPPPLRSLAPTTEYLISTLLEAPELSVDHISLPELLSVQLEKLAVNAVVNPLTVLFDCRNGELLNNFYIVQTMRVVLWEVSQVLCALPEIASAPGREVRFSAERLYDVVIKVIRATGDNWSSMVQDVRNGKQTEVDYINGFIVDKAKETGLPCTMNLMLVNVVKGKGKIVQQREKNAIPFVEA